MNFDEYQDKAAETAIYPDDYAVIYPALGLAGEAGEVANKIKKIYRDDGGRLTKAKMLDVAKELGGVLWYVAMLARDCHLSLDEIAEININELQSRKERGVLQGSGDNR